MKGRPFTFNPQVHRALVEAIRQGESNRRAAEVAGIGIRTFYRWLARGQRGEPRFARFARDISQARAQAELDDADPR